MIGEEAERQNSDSQGEKKLKGWTEAGHFTAHTSHNRNQELSGEWDQRGAGREGEAKEAQETKPLASVFTMHVKQTTMNYKHFFGGEDDMRCL